MVWLAAIEPTASAGLAAAIKVFDVAGLPDTQVAFDVRMQVIALPLPGMKV